MPHHADAHGCRDGDANQHGRRSRAAARHDALPARRGPAEGEAMIQELQSSDGRTLFVVAVLAQPGGGRRYACCESLRTARIVRSRVRDEGVQVLDHLHGLVQADVVVRDGELMHEGRTIT